MRTPWIVSAIVLVGALAGCSTGAVGGDPSSAGDDDAADAGDIGNPVPGAPDAAPPVPDAAPLPTDSPLAAGIDIGTVSVFQAVAIPLAVDGAPVSPRNAPVIEGDDAVFAISYSVAGDFAPRAIVACITIDGTVYNVEQDVSAGSGELPTAALRVKVPGAAITLTSQYVVSLHEAYGAPAQPGSTTGASYPASGTEALGALSTNGPLKLVLVPFRYNADGSGRLPATDPATVETYRAAFAAMYPVADVVVMVHAPVDTSINIRGGWSQWLDQLDGVREADAPPSNYFYYGMATPAATFVDYCHGSCIVGLGHVPDADTSFLFGAVGVTFPETPLINTARHEVGHTLGRAHAPCGGPAGIDPAYPYFGAKIGVWGYDVVNDAFYPPSDYTDIMGYCHDQWISDYQYENIFTRLSTVNGSAPLSAFGPPQTYRVGTVDADGNVIWRRTATLATPPRGGEQPVSLRDDQGGELAVVDGHFYPYDHLAGGTLYVPMAGILDTVAVAPAAYVTLPTTP